MKIEEIVPICSVEKHRGKGKRKTQTDEKLAPMVRALNVMERLHETVSRSIGPLLFLGKALGGEGASEKLCIWGETQFGGDLHYTSMGLAAEDIFQMLAKNLHQAYSESEATISEFEHFIEDLRKLEFVPSNSKEARFMMEIDGEKLLPEYLGDANPETVKELLSWLTNTNGFVNSIAESQTALDVMDLHVHALFSTPSGTSEEVRFPKYLLISLDVKTI